MIEIQGKYNTAKVFTEYLDDASRKQIETLCDQAFSQGSKIRLMPDVHAGAGCTIGTTMTITDKIVPNLVGVDIGCGMETLVIAGKHKIAVGFAPPILDKIIHSEIPSGRDVRKQPHEYTDKIDFSKIKCPNFKLDRAKKSIGTLGGGNHFIEADRDDEGNLYIVIHSGSRHLGKEIAEYYQELAWQRLKKTDIPKELAYLTGEHFYDYLNDMKITQHFADLNRKAMMNIIKNRLNISADLCLEQFTTIHNYIDTESMILRKGAVSAHKGEKLLIPMNMRDGSLLCEGLGNPDWNYSAPHGAGRIMSRRKAFSELNLKEYINSMDGIYSTTVSSETLDESPMAYKKADEIIKNMQESVKLIKIIKPIYNFKASE